MAESAEKEEEKLEFDSKEIASYIWYRCNLRNVKTNATLIQKLLYCCYGVVLALTDGKRLTWEHPQAWQYGPVFLRVFKAIRKGSLGQEDPLAFAACLPHLIKIRVDQTIDFFSKFPAGKLSAWTHMEGSPWFTVTEGGEKVPMPMEDKEILKYFKEHVLRPEACLKTPKDQHIMR